MTRRLSKRKQASVNFTATVLDAAAKHLGVVLVTGVVGLAALLFAAIKSYSPFAQGAQLNDFSGIWQITLDGDQPGHMSITQDANRTLKGTFVLDNMARGALRGVHDGHSFYSLALDAGDVTHIFIETADVRFVDKCLQADTLNAIVKSNGQKRQVKFSARRCAG